MHVQATCACQKEEEEIEEKSEGMASREVMYTCALLHRVIGWDRPSASLCHRELHWVCAMCVMCPASGLPGEPDGWSKASDG
mmetsp:Transcript_5631/g.11794  ORF Transcript_5631/g.11794 Transcript_5631/m.11794 type:complete len:82 (-) Transcript_5631:204-449(-)